MNKQGRTTVVIESTGKAEKVKELFQSLGFERINVISTKGRLLDLPQKSYGINNSNFSIFDRSPLSERKLDQVISHCQSSDSVYIMTDDDIEGEIIANDLRAISSGKDIHRIRLQSLTENALMDALKEESSIRDSLVVGGMSRRIYDRYIGYNHTKPYSGDGNIYGYVGRVTTPILNELKDSSPVKSWITYNSNDAWSVNIPITSENEYIAEDLFMAISEMSDPDIVQTGEIIEDDLSGAWTGSIALEKLSKALGASVEDISEAMQELYEEGTLSYPRTDSFYMSQETIDSMKKMAVHFGVQGFDEEFFAKKASEQKNARSQEAHEALAPLSLEINPFTPLGSLSLKDQVMTLIMRNTLRSGQNRKIKRKTGSLSSTDKNSDWLSIISKYDLNPIIESTESFVAGNNRKSYVNERTMPEGSIEASLEKNGHLLRKIPNDQIVLEAINRLSLGRPSTVSHHATKIAKKFLMPNGKLNEIGKASLANAEINAPGLLDPETSKKVEDELHFSGGTIHERVVRALEGSGVKVKESSAGSDYGDIIDNDDFFEEFMP